MYSPTAHISDPSFINPKDMVLESGQMATQQTANIDLERQHREHRLYNSRIGQALNYTLHTQVGRGAGNKEIPRQPVEIIQNFTSTEWLNIKDIPSAGGKTVDVTKQDAVPTRSPPSPNHTSGVGTICEACDDSAACQEGSYCFYSPECARRICQPLGKFKL